MPTSGYDETVWEAFQLAVAGFATEENQSLRGLISKVARWDRSAFARLYDATSSRVYGLVLRIVADRTAAEEVTLDVYTQIWNEAGRYDSSRSSVLAWLLLLARSRAIDHLRSGLRRARDAEVPMDSPALGVPDAAESPEGAALAQGVRRMVRSALSSIDRDKRAAIELAFFSELSHREVADRLGLPLGTVKTRIRTGMIELRKILQPYSSSI